MEYSLIANSGIHITTLDLVINTREKFSLWFHEWYDTTDGVWVLDLAQEVNTEIQLNLGQIVRDLIIFEYRVLNLIHLRNIIPSTAAMPMILGIDTLNLMSSTQARVPMAMQIHSRLPSV